MRHGLPLFVIGVGLLVLGYVLWGTDRTRHVEPMASVDTEGAGPEEQGPTLDASDLPVGGVSVGTGHGRIRGLVRDERENPVSGVRVAILERVDVPHLDGRGPWLVEHAFRPAEVVARLRTDEHGRFACTGLARDRGYQVHAEPEPPLLSTVATVTWRGSDVADVVLRMRTGTTLHGRVVDHQGEGVHALVSAAWRPPGPGRSHERWSLLDHGTDADGRFVLPAVPRGVLWISVRVPGQVAVSNLRVVTPRTEPLVIQLGSRDPAYVRGRVTDSAGTGIPGARVQVAAGADGPHLRTSQQLVVETGVDGAYELALDAPCRLTHVRVEAAGFLARHWASMDRPCVVGAEDTIDVVLLRGGRVRGHVRSKDGAALAGARVSVTATFPTGHLDAHASVTDADGAFEITGLAPGEHAVRAQLEGYEQEASPEPSSVRVRRLGPPGRGAHVMLPAEGATASVDITLIRGLPIVGRVVDSEGRPVADAQVRIGRRAGRVLPRGGRIVWQGGDGETRTDAQGRFRFHRRATGRDYFVVATHGDDLSEEVAARPSKEDPPDEVVLTLRPTATLAGVAQRADGSPFPYVRFQLRGPLDLSASADAHGRFRIRRLPPGQYDMALAGGLAAGSERRTLAAGDVIEDVVLRAQERLTITGVVVAEDGRPLVDTRVRIERSRERGRGTVVVSAITDAQGRFVVEGLGPGTYRARVAGTLLEQELEAGATAVRLVHARRPWSLVHGTVVDPAGRPVASGRVHVSYPLPGRPRSRTGRSAPILGGRFRFGIYTPAERVDLSVQDPRDARGAALDVAPRTWEGMPLADAPFELELRAAGTVAGVVVDTEGAPVAGAVVLAHQGAARGPRSRMRSSGSATTGSDGRFRLERLTPGVVVLRVQQPPTYLPVDEVHVTCGTPEALDVRITLRVGGFVSGRVLEADGTPAADVPVQAQPRNHPIGPWAQAMTGQDGSFRLEGLDPATEYRVRTDYDRRKGGRADLFRITSDWVHTGTTGIEIRIVKGVYITGRVLTPDGNPATAGFVSARSADPSTHNEGGAMARLDSGSGRFSIGPLAPGRYDVIAHTQVAAYGSSEPVGVEAPATDLTLRLRSLRTRPGVIHGEDVENFRVVWWVQEDDGTLALGHGIADARGHFTLGQMTNRSGTVFVYRRDDGRCAWIENVRPSDELLEIDLVEGLTITGRVEGTPSKAIQSAPFRMVMARPEGAPAFNLRSQIDAEGNFRIVGVPRGTFSVSHHALGSQGPSVVVEAGASGVVVRLE